MDIFKWLAIIGALAWLPHLIKIIKEYFTKAEVRIICSKSPEIGFSIFGPIYNTRIAFSTKNKDIVLSNLTAEVSHESGEQKKFVWQGLVQNMFHMQYPEIGRVPAEKESEILALKVKTTEIEERLVRLQEISYINKRAELEQNTAKRIIYLKENENFSEDTIFASDEMKELISFIKHSQFWKSGNYKVKFTIESPESFSLLDNEYKFTLSPVDIDQLNKNKEMIEVYYRESFRNTKLEESDLHFNWINPNLVKET